MQALGDGAQFVLVEVVLQRVERGLGVAPGAAREAVLDHRQDARAHIGGGRDGAGQDRCVVRHLVGVEIARVVLVDLLEARVQLLDLFLGELAWKFGVSHYVIINRVGTHD